MADVQAAQTADYGHFKLPINNSDAARQASHGSSVDKSGEKRHDPAAKKEILLNAFDMCTVGHLAPGQWKVTAPDDLENHADQCMQNPKDRSTSKTKLKYWTDLAILLERGGINTLFLADTFGGHDVYEDSIDNCIRRSAGFPCTDPTIPLSAMAAVTKNLCFAVTASTSFESPFLLAKRFSTLDHLTDGRFGWNIVTSSHKKSVFKALGSTREIEHDERYDQADEFVRLMYKLWEGSWAEDAVVRQADADVYARPELIRKIVHDGKYFHLDTRHIVEPSPQRTPLLFQAGTSAAGSKFAAAHAEAVFVAALSPAQIRPKIAELRQMAAELGRDPQSLKFFATFTCTLGQTEEEAQAKHRELESYASAVGGLVLFSGWTGIDISAIPLDTPITGAHSPAGAKAGPLLDAVLGKPSDGLEWTPRALGKLAALGGLGPRAVGTAAQVADVLEMWMAEADLDGFNIGHLTTPGGFEDVVALLVPELRRRGIYPEKMEDGLTARERFYGRGQVRLRDDHTGSRYRYDVYREGGEGGREGA